MTIKQQGGVFGRNPTFNDVTVEGDLSVDGTLTIGGNVITGLDYEGGWNASTNTPDLVTTPPAAGKFWIVSVAGSTDLGGITNWTVGDWALYDGSAWQRVEGGTVDLTNGVTGILPIANGGTNASDAATARTNLGSGAVGDNLFTAATALAAQQAMDVEVGVDVQAYDAGLQSISGLTTAADKMIYTTASDTYAVADLTAAGRALIDDADSAAQRTTLGSGAVGDNLFTAATALAAQQAMDVEVGVDVQPYDATILKSADIGVTVEAYDSTILKSADIGVSVQGYDADTAKYDDTTANFTGTLQNGGSNVVVDNDIGVTVEAYDATILKSADIGSTVQGYDADTAKYDDTTANFTGTLQNGGSNVVVDTDIGSTVQGYDADTAKLDVIQTWTAKQTFGDVEADQLDLNGTATLDNIASSDKLRVTASDNPAAYIEFENTFQNAAVVSQAGLLLGVNSSVQTNYAGVIATEQATNSNGVLLGLYANNGAGPILVAQARNNKNFEIVDGNLVVASGHGIDFSATSGTGTSELFDDYEEGTWTPTFSAEFTTAPTITSAQYTKIGRQVTVTMLASDGVVTAGGSIGGLPFASNASQGAGAYGGNSDTTLSLQGTVGQSASSITNIPARVLTGATWQITATYFTT